MAGLDYLSRVSILIFIIISVFVGGYTNNWDTTVNKWRDLPFSTQLVVTIVFIWPLIGYVTPVLLDLWGFLALEIVGLGGEFLITDIQTQLLLLVIAVLAAQTTILMMRLKQIEEQV